MRRAVAAFLARRFDPRAARDAVAFLLAYGAMSPDALALCALLAASVAANAGTAHALARLIDPAR